MRPNDQNGIEPVAQRAVLHRRGVFFNRGCCGLHWQHHLYWHFTHQVSISISYRHRVSQQVLDGNLSAIKFVKLKGDLHFLVQI